MALSIVLWAAFVGDFATDSQIPVATRALSLSYNALTLASLSLLLRIIFATQSRPPAAYYLSFANLAFFLVDIASAFEFSEDRGFAISVALSPMVYGLALAAILHPSAPSIWTKEELTEDRVGPARLAMLALAIGAPFFAIALWPAASTGQRVVQAALGFTLAWMLITRVVRLLRYNQEVADREGILAEEIARLGAHGSREKILDDLPISAMRLVPAQFRASVQTEDPTNGNDFSADIAIPHTSQIPRLVVKGPTPLGSLEKRLVSSLARNAGLLVGSADAIEQVARQRSDLEANKRIAINERRFRALVQNASDLVLVIDHDASITYMSEASQRILGREADTYVGQDLSLIHISEPTRPY